MCSCPTSPHGRWPTTASRAACCAIWHRLKLAQPRAQAGAGHLERSLRSRRPGAQPPRRPLCIRSASPLHPLCIPPAPALRLLRTRSALAPRPQLHAPNSAPPMLRPLGATPAPPFLTPGTPTPQPLRYARCCADTRACGPHLVAAPAGHPQIRRAQASPCGSSSCTVSTTTRPATGRRATAVTKPARCAISTCSQTCGCRRAVGEGAVLAAPSFAPPASGDAEGGRGAGGGSGSPSALGRRVRAASGPKGEVAVAPSAWTPTALPILPASNHEQADALRPRRAT